MDRRQALLAAATAALPATSALGKTETIIPDVNNCAGFVTIYLSVGHINHDAAQEFAMKTLESIKADKIKLGLRDWTFFLLPVRPPEESHIVIQSADGKELPKLTISKIMKAIKSHRDEHLDKAINKLKEVEELISSKFTSQEDQVRALALIREVTKTFTI